MGEIAEKAVSNTIYLALNWISITFLSLIFWIVAGKFLLPSEYGKGTTAFQIVFFLSSIANLGLGFALNKKIPELIAKRQEKKIPTLIKFSLRIVFSTGIILFFVIILLTPLLSEKLGYNLRDTIFIGATVIFAQLSLLFSRVWYGYQNMKKIWLNNTFNQLSRIIVASILVIIGFSYFGLIAGIFVLYLVSTLMYFSPKFIRNGENFDTKKLFYDLALPAFFANIFWMIFKNTQYIILSLLKTTEATGYFSLAFMISSLMVGIINIITFALFPLVSSLNSFGKKKARDKLISLGIRYGLLIGLPLIAFLLVFGKEVISLFFRVEYLPAADLFVYLLPGAILFGISNIILTNLYAVGEAKLYRNLSIIVTLVYLSTAIWFSYLWSYIGMAISYLLTTFVELLLVYFFGRKYFSFTISKINLSKIFVVSFIFIFILFYGIRLVSLNFFVKLFFILFVSFGYPFFLKVTKVYSEEDKKIILVLIKKIKILDKMKIIIFFT